MVGSFLQVLYGLGVLFLLWQAFRVISRGWLQNRNQINFPKPQAGKMNDDRTGRLTVHPELLDEEGRITDEELLTVRFSEDIDPPQEAETST